MGHRDKYFLFIVVAIISCLLDYSVCASQKLPDQYTIFDDSEDWEPYDGTSFHPILRAHHDADPLSNLKTFSEAQKHDEDSNHNQATLEDSNSSGSSDSKPYYDAQATNTSDSTVTHSSQETEQVYESQSLDIHPGNGDKQPIDRNVMTHSKVVELGEQTATESVEALNSQTTNQDSEAVTTGAPHDNEESTVQNLPTEQEKQSRVAHPTGSDVSHKDAHSAQDQGAFRIREQTATESIEMASQDTSSTSHEEVQTEEPGLEPGDNESHDDQDDTQDESTYSDNGHHYNAGEASRMPDRQDADVLPTNFDIGNTGESDVSLDMQVHADGDLSDSETSSDVISDNGYWIDISLQTITLSSLTVLSFVLAVIYQVWMKNDPTPIKPVIRPQESKPAPREPPANRSKDREIKSLEKKITMLAKKLRLAPLEVAVRQLQCEDPNSRLAESKVYLHYVQSYESLLARHETLNDKVKMERYERLLQIRNLKDINKIPGVLRYIDYRLRVESKELNVCSMELEDEVLREQMELFRTLKDGFQREYLQLKSDIEKIRSTFN